jgi:cell division septum initiation protein DivIVA
MKEEMTANRKKELEESNRKRKSMESRLSSLTNAEREDFFRVDKKYLRTLRHGQTNL